ncbi:hypothetical protein NC653_034226 [Populus alba x Populus x berolinensis]|uniref:Uncharacterized protein n=1 Tax=Populus alba x Populus x berolinensis TaxID=444605 RepID=A0AAD6PVT3_9ROSI|nr:hypothetical protein NC653_034226 [Populus alba x Populus x berolinensis]
MPMPLMMMTAPDQGRYFCFVSLSMYSVESVTGIMFCYNPFVTMRPYAGSTSNSIFFPELVCVCNFTVTAEAMHVPEIRCALYGLFISGSCSGLLRTNADVLVASKWLITFLFLDELLIFCYESYVLLGSLE